MERARRSDFTRATCTITPAARIRPVVGQRLLDKSPLRPAIEPGWKAEKRYRVHPENRGAGLVDEDGLCKWFSPDDLCKER